MVIVFDLFIMSFRVIMMTMVYIMFPADNDDIDDDHMDGDN